MNNKLFLAILVLILSQTKSIAYNTIDSLKQQLTVQGINEKIETHSRIAKLLIAENDINEADKYAIEAMNLARETNQPKSLAIALDINGQICESRFDYTNAMKNYIDALKLKTTLKDNKGIADSKNHIGRVFYFQKDEKNAIENLQAALKIYQNLNDKNGIADSYKFLGDVYLQQKIYGNATDAYKHAMETCIEIRELGKASNLASFLGEIVRDMGDYEGAMVYYSTALDIHSSMEDLPKIAKDHLDIANVQLGLNDFEAATEANETANKLFAEVKDNFGQAQSTLLAAKIAFKQNDKTNGLKYLENTASLVKNIGFKPGVQNIFQEIASTYKNLGMFDKAYEYSLNYSTSKDSLYNKEKAEALLTLTTKYQSELGVQEQAKQIAILEKQRESDLTIRYAMFGLLGLLSLLLFSLYNNYRIKKKDNELLQAKNIEIAKKNEEIEAKNIILAQKNNELDEKNAKLDVLNQRLVNEMAERESIEKSSFARDHFLATMSHEMRTPLNIIVGLTHLLLEENPRKEQIEHLRTLQFSSNNLIVLINDVLDYSKIEAGKLTLEKRIFSPSNILEEIQRRFAPSDANSAQQIQFYYDQELPTKLQGDPVRLNQILTNLLNNARKHTPNGEIAVHITCEKFDAKNIHLQLLVTDNGTGIEQSKLEEMLNKFSRSSEDIYGGYENSGLGLAITKRLVELQNGTLTAQSEIGKGSTFKVILPFLLDTTGAKIFKMSPNNYDFLSSKKILLVEDNKINSLVVANMLRKYDVNVITAENGLEALDAMQSNDFDLILMDIQMPKMDGYRATAEIRKLPIASKRNTPIIALTASAFLSEKEKAELFGMSDHIGKPFAPEELLEKISNVIAKDINEKA